MWVSKTGLTQEFKENWSTINKLWFRYLFSYFFWYLLLFFLAGAFLETPLRWLGETVLGINYDYDTNGNGSGDNTFAYIKLFATLLLGIISGALWSLLDRRSKNYHQMFYWLLVVLRILLVGAMLLYGFAKVFQVQFQPPSLSRLLQPLGEFSPMGLAWTYMGYSKGFGVFAGIMEVLGGLLLIPKRTQTLGALIVMGVMSQVAMMNLMFDIPVKLFSIHLVLIAAVIFSTDIRRFSHVFIKNKAVEAYQYYHPIANTTYHKIIIWVKSVGLVVALIGASIFALNLEKQRSKKPPLYGIWEVDLFVKNGDTLLPLLSTTKRWKRLVVDKRATLAQTMDDQVKRYRLDIDSTLTKLALYESNSDQKEYNFSNSSSNPERLELRGILEKDTLHIALKRKDLDDFLLHSRGFHWINETPLNR
ncbi:hypothetical protein [Spongiimicrobium salis]|uniref:hypothetical protein n=1 Tax=Spongiimicrobium salis TaxID=1667022 RepID=UPI00374D5EF6